MSGMESEEPLLSICIPTYNRVQYLRGALENITSDKAFTSKVEIVISDNASEDDTQLLGEEYANKYENILYYRNETNIRDENFFLALSRSRGRYVRLCNDTLRFKKDTLSVMLHQIETSSEEIPLFFIQNISFLNKNMSKTVIGTQDLLENVSYWTTGMGNFGTWRKSLKQIEIPNKYAKMQLAQVDWFFQLVLKKKSQIFFGDFFETIYPSKKGGYNFFYVFVVNYLFILKEHITNPFVLEKEKYRLFRYHLIPFYCRLVLKKLDEFYVEDALSIIMKYYWYCPYMYVGLIYAKLRTLLQK